MIVNPPYSIEYLQQSYKINKDKKKLIKGLRACSKLSRFFCTPIGLSRLPSNIIQNSNVYIIPDLRQRLEILHPLMAAGYSEK